MTAIISDLLAELEAPGTFATRLRAPADALDIEVTGVGRLSFPITSRTAKKLRDIAHPSPFGLREQTLHDPSVRNSREMPASRVKIAARRFQPVLAQHLPTLRAELGFPEGCELKAAFDKLLLYEEGQFFKTHQDSEKNDDMVATLVVLLPSEYSGGVLTVEHRGETKTFRRLSSQTQDLSLIAFYADCHHAVSPIKSGVRVALTYHLSLVKRSNDRHSCPQVSADAVDRLTTEMHTYFATPVAKRYSHAEPAAPERLVYLLDHEYTQRSLSWTHLKNSDGVRVAALRSAAERLDCECFLALAEVHESWMCEDDDDYPRGRYARRCSRYEDDEDDADTADEHELIELLENTIELNHWLDVAGTPIEGIPGTVSDEELHFTKPSSDLDPFQSEYEGYQGNYGNTVDRWYHRAAFVMWPRANTFALRAQASPQWAVDELLALPRSNTSELETRVKALLPRWRQTASNVDGAQFFAKLIKFSTRNDDPVLTRGLLSPLGLQRLANKTMRRDLATLVDRHGLPWAQELIAEWTQKQHWETSAWAPLLVDLCADLHASKRVSCAALANWLLEREVKSARERCVAALKRHQPWLDLDAYTDESKQLAHVLAAAVAISARGVIEDTSSFLLSEKPGFPTAFFAQLLQACVARSPALRAYVLGSPLQRVCTERLEAVLRVPIRAKDDWTIHYPLICGCADCKVLSQFLRSADTERDWPLNEGRRQHIHGTIDSAKLPVLHTTLRRGSPYVLQLRKDHALFTRERAYLSRVKDILNALRTPRSRRSS
jgi:predicted 2-oxoglutarate/Fe(II)-dependent dioxygenase YbiX